MREITLMATPFPPTPKIIFILEFLTIGPFQLLSRVLSEITGPSPASPIILHYVIYYKIFMISEQEA